MLLKRIYAAHPVLGQLSHRAMGLLGMGGALAKLARIYIERKKSSKKCEGGDCCAQANIAVMVPPGLV